MGKRLLLLGIFLSFTSGIVSAQQINNYNVYIGPQGGYQSIDCPQRSSRYDYAYSYPPRQSLYAMGRYISSRSGVRYVPSVSKLKRERHAQRIRANNRLYAYGY